MDCTKIFAFSPGAISVLLRMLSFISDGETQDTLRRFAALWNKNCSIIIRHYIIWHFQQLTVITICLALSDGYLLWSK